MVATGRSDFPNQINNVLGFPGIFKGALRPRPRHQRGDEDGRRLGHRRPDLRRTTSEENIIPGAFDPRVARPWLPLWQKLPGRAAWPACKRNTR